MRKLVLGSIFVLCMLLSVFGASALVDGVIENVNIDSNDARFSGEFLVATFIATPTSTDSLIAEIDSGTSVDGRTTRDQISVRGTVVDNEVIYATDTSRIDQVVGRVVTVHDSDFGHFGRTACENRASEAWAGDPAAVEGPITVAPSIWGFCDWWYFKYTGSLSNPAELRTGNPKTTTQWIVTKEGVTHGLTDISNSDDDFNIGEFIVPNQVFVEYIGDLSGFFDKPEVGRNIILIDTQNTNVWQMADSSDYDRYEDEIRRTAPLTLERDTDIDEWYSSQQFVINNAHSDLVGSKASGDFDPSINPLISGIDFSSGNLVVSLTNQIRYPKFRLLIDGDFIGLEILTGVPNILSVTDAVGVEGQPSRITVTVRNDGTARGSFELFSRNCDSSRTSVEGITFSLNEGEQRTYSLMQSANVAVGDSISGSCDMVMKEIKTGEEDVLKYDYDFTNNLDCFQGQERVVPSASGDQIQVCDNAGNWQFKEQCGSNQVAVWSGTEYVCQGTDEPLPPPDDDSGDNLSKVRIILSALIALILGAVAWAYSGFMSKTKGLQITRVIIVIAIIGGGFFGVGWLLREVFEFFSNLFGGLFG